MKLNGKVKLASIGFELNNFNDTSPEKSCGCFKNNIYK